MPIIDASVAGKWLVAEPDSEKAEALIGQALAAPELLVAESSNIAWKKWRRNEIGEEQAIAAQSVIKSFVELVPIGPLAEHAIGIAMELRHPVYDCFYLAMCEMSDAPLITADLRFLQRCRGTRWESLVEAL